jgi:hypothetical protein
MQQLQLGRIALLEDTSLVEDRFQVSGQSGQLLFAFLAHVTPPRLEPR